MSEYLRVWRLVIARRGLLRGLLAIVQAHGRALVRTGAASELIQCLAFGYAAAALVDSIRRERRRGRV